MKSTIKKSFTLFLTVILFAFALCVSASAADKIATPKKLKATPTTSSVTLKWSKVKGADYYRIYYKTSKDGKWKTAVKKTTETKETLKKLPSGKKYYFAVRSFDKTKNGTVYSEMKEVKMATMPKKTAKITATPKMKQVKLSWEKVKGATHYRVYQKINGEWKSIAFTEKTSFTVKELKTATKYNFAVRAYVKSQSYTVAGARKSVSVMTNSQVPNVTGLTFEQGSEIVIVKREPFTYYGYGVIDENYAYSDEEFNGVELMWKNVKNAKGYKVYIYEKNQWKQIDNTKNTSCIVRDLTPGKVYKFAVKAYADIKGKTVYSSEYATVSAASVPEQSKIYMSVSGRTVNLSWDKVECTGYLLYVNYNGFGYTTIKIPDKNTTSYSLTHPDYASHITVYVRPYSKTSKGDLKCNLYYNIEGHELTPYVTQTSGGIKIKPVTSEEAKKIVESSLLFEKYDSYEGKSADGKKIVVYARTPSGWSGRDIEETRYNEYGKNIYCEYCGLKMGEKDDMCDGDCAVVFH